MREIGDIDKLKNQYIAYLGFEKGLSHNSVEAYVDDTEKFCVMSKKAANSLMA